MKPIKALVLAAGLSRRMGTPKMLLKWGETTVIGAVIKTLKAGGITDIVVVSGGAHDLLEPILLELGVQSVFNSKYDNGEMLDSLQAGLQVMKEHAGGVLIVLGDQPQMLVETVRQVTEAYQAGDWKLVMPSFQMRRGHPWIVDSSLIGEINRLEAPQTMRDFMLRHAADIRYVVVDTPTIFQDMDTPEDYDRYRPK
jgi:molybdenum cofactor cytidylyltransferase